MTRYWKYDEKFMPISERPDGTQWTIEEIQQGLSETFSQLRDAKHQIKRGEDIQEYLDLIPNLDIENDEVIVFYIEGGKNGINL